MCHISTRTDKTKCLRLPVLLPWTQSSNILLFAAICRLRSDWKEVCVWAGLSPLSPPQTHNNSSVPSPAAPRPHRSAIKCFCLSVSVGLKGSFFFIPSCWGSPSCPADGPKCSFFSFELNQQWRKATVDVNKTYLNFTLCYNILLLHNTDANTPLHLFYNSSYFADSD